MTEYYDQELIALLLIDETGLIRQRAKAFFNNTKEFYYAFKDLTAISSERNKNVHLMVRRACYPYEDFYGEVQDNYNKFIFSIEKKFDENIVKCSGSIFTGMETKQVFSCEIKSKKGAKSIPFADAVLAYKRARAENNLISENIVFDGLDQI